MLRLDRTAGCVVGHSHYYLFGLVNEISGRADVNRTGLRVSGTKRAGAAGQGGPMEDLEATQIVRGRVKRTKKDWPGTGPQNRLGRLIIARIGWPGHVGHVGHVADSLCNSK